MCRNLLQMFLARGGRREKERMKIGLTTLSNNCNIDQDTSALKATQETPTLPNRKAWVEIYRVLARQGLLQ
jgi:hypothetical protein